MKNIGTAEEVQQYEKEKVSSFMKEFADLCKKYKIKGAFFGTRKQSQKFTDKEDSLCAAFSGGMNLNSLNKFEAESMLKVLDDTRKEVLDPVVKAAGINVEEEKESHKDHLVAMAFVMASILEDIIKSDKQKKEKKGFFGRMFGR